MEEKTYSVKNRHNAYTFFSWLGVIVAVAGYLLGGVPKAVLPWIGFALVALAVVYRIVFVRCPYCGNHLTESKRIPDKCPECHKELG